MLYLLVWTIHIGHKIMHLNFNNFYGAAVFLLKNAIGILKMTNFITLKLTFTYNLNIFLIHGWQGKGFKHCMLIKSGVYAQNYFTLFSTFCLSGQFTKKNLKYFRWTFFLNKFISKQTEWSWVMWINCIFMFQIWRFGEHGTPSKSYSEYSNQC